MRDYEALVRTIITPLVKNEQALLIRQDYTKDIVLLLTSLPKVMILPVLIGRRAVLSLMHYVK